MNKTHRKSPIVARALLQARVPDMFTFIGDLQKAQDIFNKQVNKLGEKIRTHLLLPVCKKHNLEFLSGNGDFFFITKEGDRIGDISDAQGTKLERPLTPVFGLLCLEVTLNFPLGFYVLDIRKEDY